MTADSDPWLIRVEGLRKKYCRDLRRSLWYSLCDVTEGLGLRKTDPEVLREHEFWAVDGVSFTLNRGDSLGLLGRNGAGKSTLLKVITGQRSITAGTVATRGRMLALTELGLGFDPALTGRENAFVNAALHGISPRDFRGLIEQIIEFSELREFIDSAVHTYSTGMKARLGFAVATHLDPDVLIVDEVLAVGDLDFRRKCVRHIQGYLERGGSIVLVAHDPYLVQSICNRAIILDRGRMIFEGTAIDGVDVHFRLGQQNQYAAVIEEPKAADEAAPEEEDTGSVFPPRMELTEQRPIVLDGIQIVPAHGSLLHSGESARVHFYYRALADMKVGVGFSILTGDLQTTVTACSTGLGSTYIPARRGNHRITCTLPELNLVPGVYALRGGIGDPEGNAAYSILGYQDIPLFFTVEAKAADKMSNWLAMQKALTVLRAEFEQAVTTEGPATTTAGSL